ncbi:MAG: HD domain-containing protein [marine benthic group bacterium]|jgi:HD superfamily phosphohydrolase YqeK|nr:HD domain-containing protein [Gemmatimonadota bacterium]
MNNYRSSEGEVSNVPPELHPLVEAAGRRGTLPEWAACRPERREHSARVAELMAVWSRDIGLPAEDRVRWVAAGHLHDALKDAPVEALRSLAGPDWPDPLLHAPACAVRLEMDGVRDEELLLAIAHHSTGHPDLGALGECLYMADFLEPGRGYMTQERKELRGRMPAEHSEVLQAVIRHRMARLIDRGLSLRDESIQFWNRAVGS